MSIFLKVLHLAFSVTFFLPFRFVNIITKAQKAFEAERAQYRREKLEFDVTQKLAEKKLPVKFSKYISAMGADNVEENIKELEGLLGENRQSIVNEITKGSAPHKGGGNPTEADPFLAGFGK